MQRNTSHSEASKKKIRATLKKYWKDLKENHPDEYQDFCHRTSIGQKKAQAKRKK